MERGFFHPDRGYWQAIDVPEEALAALLESYPEGTIEVPTKPSQHHEWENGAWVERLPPEPTPEELRQKMPRLTARQLRMGLVTNGIALSSVDAAIAAIADPTQRELSKIEWEYATEFNRTNPLLLQVGSGLGLTPEQIDVMWLASKEL